MELREQIRHWAGWPGWRRHAPAAGSLVAHASIGLAMIGMVAASGRPPAAKLTIIPEAIEVSLIADSLPMPVRPAPRPTPATAKSEPADAAPSLPPPRRNDRQPTTATPPRQPAPVQSNDSVYLGPSPFAQPVQPGGLEGLASRDPCATRIGLKAKDCVTNWAAAVCKMDTIMPRSKEELRTYHAEFMTHCARKVGCEPTDGRLNNGTRTFGQKSPMAPGAGGVQGINEIVGRLGFNPDHTDPGFGD